MEVTVGKILITNHGLYLKEEKLAGYLKTVYQKYRSLVSNPQLP